MNLRYAFTPAIVCALMEIEAALTLSPSPRAARDLLAAWGADGWLEVADPARKSRRYRLSAEYRQFIGEITAL